MPSSLMNKTILHGTPLVWIHKIATGAITALWTFNNAQNYEAVLKLPSTASNETETIDIGRADGATIKWTKQTLEISGVDESDITSTASSSYSTNMGTIKITLNEAEIGAATWTEFIEALQSEIDSTFFITIGTGQSLTSTSNATYRKPDGFIHMIGKLNSDVTLSWAGNTPTTITLEFTSYKDPEDAIVASDVTDLYDGTSKHGILWKLGNAGDITIYPPAITSATNILDGKPQVVKNIDSFA